MCDQGFESAVDTVGFVPAQPTKQRHATKAYKCFEPKRDFTAATVAVPAGDAKHTDFAKRIENSATLRLITVVSPKFEFVSFPTSGILPGSPRFK